MDNSNKKSCLISRYARQMAIEGVGEGGQLKIRDSKILVIGCGALGSMVAMQLAGAGVGCIGIADFDNIDVSNLQRQFFFKTFEAGQAKVETLKKRIKELNPECEVKVYKELILKERAQELFIHYDFILDCTDNPSSKKITGDISQITGKACCIGGINEFGGQVVILFPSDPRFEEFFGISTGGHFLPCSIGGVWGPAAVFCASIQASEALKYIAEIDRSERSGSMIVFDLRSNLFKKLLF